MGRHRAVAAATNRRCRLRRRQSRRLDAAVPCHGSPSGRTDDRPARRMNLISLTVRRIEMKRRTFCRGAIAALAALPLPAMAAPIRATLFRNPQCYCCDIYAAYLRENGFEVDVKSTNDLAEINGKAGFPENIQGWHAMFVDGYVIDALVPVNIVRKLLSQPPAIAP